MIRIFSCDDPSQAASLLGSREEVRQDVAEQVSRILEEVRCRGDEAVIAYTKEFDHAVTEALEVPVSEMEAAKQRIDPAFLAVLEEAAENIRRYHQAQLKTGYLLDPRPGVVMGQRILPLERVGVYVPGGTARYPSTVLMDVIPARIAGVDEVIVCSPPGPDGSLPDDILAAAAVAGVHRIFRMGGAQAVAALAYGTQSVPRVDKIVGPGNLYVATAKQLVYGQVDIDMIAGPSDILIVADENSNPVHLAADLLSQAEHDPLAQAVLATTSQSLAEAVQRELESQLAALPREETARQSIQHHGAIFVVDTLEQAVAVSNSIAPEHLELCVEQPFELLPLVRHAGSVFLGRHTPEALGDYLAGPNHTLPTEGTARFSSPLSVDDFQKKSSFLSYSSKALEEVADQVMLFARREGLEAHARSVEVRRENGR